MEPEAGKCFSMVVGLDMNLVAHDNNNSKMKDKEADRTAFVIKDLKKKGNDMSLDIQMILSMHGGIFIKANQNMKVLGIQNFDVGQKHG